MELPIDAFCTILCLRTKNIKLPFVVWAVILKKHHFDFGPKLCENWHTPDEILEMATIRNNLFLVNWVLKNHRFPRISGTVRYAVEKDFYDILLLLLIYAPRQHKVALEHACFLGKEELAVELYEPDEFDEDLIYIACEGGNPRLFRFFWHLHSKVSAPRISKCAYVGGNEKIIDFITKGGLFIHEAALRGAAQGGHVELVRSLLVTGAAGAYNAFSAACLAGKLGVVELLLPNVQISNSAFVMACKGGCLEIVKMLEPKNVDEGILAACHRKNIEIVVYLAPKATNMTKIMEIAISNGYVSIVRALTPRYATNELFLYACGFNHRAVAFLLQDGFDVQRGEQIARKNGHDFVIEWFKRNTK